MEDEAKYDVSYIASAPEELKVGDRVELCNLGESLEHCNGLCGTIEKVLGEGRYSVVTDEGRFDAIKGHLRKLPDVISFEEESDNVKAFRTILNEMAETYEAKDATYGNAYQDGFNRFGAVQLVSRMYEKYCRIENLLVHNADNKVPDESVMDTLTDLAVQCICLRMLLQKNDFENVD